MVWELHISCIVMLTKCIEGGKVCGTRDMGMGTREVWDWDQRYGDGDQKKAMVFRTAAAGQLLHG